MAATYAENKEKPSSSKALGAALISIHVEQVDYQPQESGSIVKELDNNKKCSFNFTTGHLIWQLAYSILPLPMPRSY